jgi:hypothetical protein
MTDRNGLERSPTKLRSTGPRKRKRERAEERPAPQLPFASVWEGSRDESGEGDFRRRAELGRLLAAAKGYRVFTLDGEHMGWLDRIRYERHTDHPDEIVLRGRGLLGRRRRALPFDAVDEVRPREKTIVLRTSRGTIERSPPTKAHGGPAPCEIRILRGLLCTETRLSRSNSPALRLCRVVRPPPEDNRGLPGAASQNATAIAPATIAASTRRKLVDGFGPVIGSDSGQEACQCRSEYPEDPRQECLISGTQYRLGLRQGPAAATPPKMWTFKKKQAEMMWHSAR